MRRYGFVTRWSARTNLCGCYERLSKAINSLDFAGSAGHLGDVVYAQCMSRTNIDIDDELCQRVMDRYHLVTKRDAVNLALSRLAGEPLGVDEARSLRGSGWDGDLGEMRASRA